MEREQIQLELFHVLGHTCYILNGEEQLGKNNSKSDEEILLGYSLNNILYSL